MSYVPPADFSYYVSKFFTEYMMKRRNASSHTILSYRDTFSLLLQFCICKGLRIEKMPVNSIDKELICDFLAWLADERKCGVSTQNQRLAATHAFFRFIQMEEPKYLLTAQSILAILFQISDM